MVHVGHADPFGLLLDRVLGLLLRADEQDGAVPLGEVARERRSLLERLQSLLQVDDVDAAALAEDVALHLRVPAAGLVAEMDPGLQQLSHGDDGHVLILSLGLRRFCRRDSGGTGLPSGRHRHPCEFAGSGF